MTMFKYSDRKNGTLEIFTLDSKVTKHEVGSLDNAKLVATNFVKTHHKEEARVEYGLKKFLEL